MPYLLLFLLMLAAPAPAQSDPPTDAGAGPIRVGARTQVQSLDSLVATGRVSPALYQALGNARFERGELGLAVLAYERGLRLRPGHPGLTNNLAYVRAEAGIERLELPDFWLARWWRRAGAALGATTCYALAIGLWWLAVAGATVWYLRRRRMSEQQRFALLPAAAVCLLLAAICWGLGHSRAAWLTDDRTAVLTARTADLRVAPGPDATLEKALSQGLKLRILDERDGYVKVALDDGKQGWLPLAAVDRVYGGPPAG